MVGSPEQVTPDTEEIEHESVYRQEALRMSDGFEPPHLTLPLSGGLMGDLRSIVLVLPGTVNHGWHHGAVRGVVAGFEADAR